MYEKLTYEAILSRMLSRVPDGVDKRQGSIIYDALAPAAAELAQMYIDLDYILSITFAETAASGGHSEWLSKRCDELGVHRTPASHAVRLGLFFSGSADNRQPLDVPIGSRFALLDTGAAAASTDARYYIVAGRMDVGQYRLSCETVGVAGNQLFGRLIPVENIPNLTYAELADVLIPGEAEESDAHLYERYEAAVNEQPYGGNIADYKRKVNAIEGVGGCRIYPVWNGGGTVRVVIIGADYLPPSEVFVADVQEMLDPEPYHQQGRGVAPIGHWVTVEGVYGRPLAIAAKIQLKNSVTLGQVEEDIATSIADYCHELAKSWVSSDEQTPWLNAESLIVRVSQIEARILDVVGVVDVFDVTIDGQSANIRLDENHIPVLEADAISLEAVYGAI